MSRDLQKNDIIKFITSGGSSNKSSNTFNNTNNTNNTKNNNNYNSSNTKQFSGNDKNYFDFTVPNPNSSQSK